MRKKTSEANTPPVLDDNQLLVITHFEYNHLKQVIANQQKDINAMIYIFENMLSPEACKENGCFINDTPSIKFAKKDSWNDYVNKIKKRLK